MREQAEKLRQRAFAARREKRLADASKDLIEAVALCRQSGEEVDLATTLTALGQIERDLKNMEAARKNYEEAAAIYRAKKDVLRLAHTIRHLGDIHRHQKEGVIAEQHYREALQLYRGDSNTPPLDLANAIRGFAILKDDSGERDQARQLWQEARDLYVQVDVKEGVAEASRRLERLRGFSPA